MNIFKYHLSMIDSFYPQLILNFSHFSFYLFLVDSKSIFFHHSVQIIYNFLD